MAVIGDVLVKLVADFAEFSKGMQESSKQLDDFARLDIPLVSKQVRQFAFQEETVGEQLVAGILPQAQVLDRMTERPVAQAVQHGRNRNVAKHVNLKPGWRLKVS